MFNEKYEKFLKTVTDFDLIPIETKKVVIGMSGGKDAAVMTHFFMEYKRRERPDLELELLLAEVPHPFANEVSNIVFETPVNEDQRKLLIEQKKAMDEMFAYWSQYMECKIAPVQHELIDSRILKMNWACILCFNTKMKAFNEYLNNPIIENHSLFACGWTKWDAHYTLLSHLLKSDGSLWYDIKAKNPLKYKADSIFLASFAAYPKIDMGIPQKSIYRINPMIEFDDTETSKLAKELNVPLVYDICGDLFENTFEQDRRYLSKYLEIFTRNQRHLKLADTSILFNYRTFLKFMQNLNLIPPVEELHGIICNAYNSNFDETFDLLKK